MHGFLGSGRNLASFARRWTELDSSLRLILPDLTGHGDSPALPPDGDLTTMARDVLALADFLHVPKPLTLVGHSQGGRVALAARLLNPEAVGKIILLDISPRPLGALAEGLQQVLDRLLVAPANSETREEMRDFFTRDGISGPMADWLLMNLLHEGGYYRWRIDRPSLGAFQKRAGVDLWAALSGPGLTARCIRGGNSSFVSDEDAKRMESLGCKVDTLPNAGHFIHVDQQAALLELLTQ